MKRLVALASLLVLSQLACYNTYTISKTELQRLESGQEAENVVVQSTEGEQFDISPETPLEVQTTEGAYRITPFNFLLSETQLVSPDYDLLLPANTVQSAEVREISYGKTMALVGTIVLGVGGGMAVLMLTGD